MGFATVSVGTPDSTMTLLSELIGLYLILAGATWFLYFLRVLIGLSRVTLLGVFCALILFGIRGLSALLLNLRRVDIYTMSK